MPKHQFYLHFHAEAERHKCNHNEQEENQKSIDVLFAGARFRSEHLSI